MPSIKDILSLIARVVGLMFITFVALILIIVGLNGLFGSPITPGDLQVTTVTGTLAEKPYIQAHGRGSMIRLLLNEYPDRSFNLDAVNATRWVPLSEDVYAGDTVTMEVSTDDYKENIEQQQFPDRILPVAVYALQSKGYVYISLDDYCKDADDHTGAAIIALVMGCSIVFAFYFEFLKKKRRRNKRKLKILQNQPD